MTDRDTGKLKGYGFCEFMDLAVAESAKRNLNGREYNGRQLRVDFAGDGDAAAEKKTEKRQGAAATPLHYDTPMGNATASSAQQQMHAAGLGGGMDAVTARLAGMSPAQPSRYEPAEDAHAAEPEPGASVAGGQPPTHAGAVPGAARAGDDQAPAAMVATAHRRRRASRGARRYAAARRLSAGDGCPGRCPGNAPPAVPGMPQYGAPQYPPPPPRPAKVARCRRRLGGRCRVRRRGAPDQQQQLLQQVISMTPEQMALLPPDQRQQVEMLRQLAVQQGM